MQRWDCVAAAIACQLQARHHSHGPALLAPAAEAGGVFQLAARVLVVAMRWSFEAGVVMWQLACRAVRPIDRAWDVLTRQRGATRCLVIFDNADAPELLAPGGHRPSDGTGWLRPEARLLQKDAIAKLPIDVALRHRIGL